ncbi:MAG: phosphate ABC transporter substrate-binding protein [Planctomycetota bacterium]|nr:MAG: phosphate ABC transporter substrate-binding protein [Planctomycetota bacterium]
MRVDLGFKALKPNPSPASGKKGLQVDAKIGMYRKINKELSGNLNAVGSDTMINLMGKWQESFRRYYPGVTIGVEGKGSSTAPPALIKGTAQLGPMSRAMKDKERDEFIKRYGYAPTQVRTCMDALAVYVHKDNPIPGLTLKQVDAIFSKNRKLGFPRNLDNWGSLGIGPAAISLYGRNSASGTYGFFKSVALGKGDYKDTVKEQPGSAGVVSSVANDRHGIGYSGIGYKTSEVRAVPLGKEAGKFFEADLNNVIQNKYPLGRFLYLYINKTPNKEMDQLQAEFLKFILSKEGQQDVIAAGYLPMPAKLVDRMRKELGFEPISL